LTGALLLHSAHAVSWGTWDIKPSVLGIALAVAGAYGYALLSDKEAITLRRAAFFLAGVLVMFLALVSPLDAAAHRLLSMHMLQHVALTTIGPPLILLGLSPGMLRPLLAHAGVRDIARLATNPAFAGTLFIANMWLWHVPWFYTAALEHLSVHITMHIAFMGTGLLFWWPVVCPLPQLGRASEIVLILYLIAVGLPMGLISLLFFAAGSPVYDYYAAGERLWGISPLIDQQLAGLVMGALGEAAGFVAITVLFLRFLDREEAEAAPAPAPGRADAR
jgi:putative membrane protein